nr:MAG TPA: hypothetical protein [Caudoviricetes sp.]DAO56618.1 MAG TPA: hypothetical protein [Caudoviricetes sp.]
MYYFPFFHFLLALSEKILRITLKTTELPGCTFTSPPAKQYYHTSQR